MTQKEIMEHLQTWPGEFTAAIKSPALAFPALPETGSWERPLIRLAAAGLVFGLVQAFRLMFVLPAFAIGGLISSLIGSVVGCAIGAVVLNFVLAAFGKDPKFYRTFCFASLLSIVTPISAVGTYMSPYLTYVPFLVFAYGVYWYAQVVAGWTKKNATILVLVMAGLTVLPALGMLLGVRAMLGGYGHPY